MEDIVSLFWFVFFLGRWIMTVAVLLGAGWYIGSKYLDYQKERWETWQKLAEQNNLTFHPSELFTNAEVTGNYREYNFLLQTCKRNYGNGRRTYTQIALFRNSPQATPSHFASELSTVDDIINLLEPPQLDIGLWERVIASTLGREITYEKPGLETDFEQLQYLLDWLHKIAEHYLTIVSLGGLAVPVLQNFVRRDSRLKLISTQLLKDIAQETTNRLSRQASKLRCVNCLTRCEGHQIQLSWHEPITYYGCRICGQSQEFHTQPTVIAVLNNQTDTELETSSNVLKANWVVRRKLFDFDAVEIVGATDEEVERFAVQVGNDTDVTRASKYVQISCIIHSDCKLTENTLRILRRIFGRVEIRKQGGVECMVDAI